MDLQLSLSLGSKGAGVSGPVNYWPTGNPASPGAGESNSLASFSDPQGHLSVESSDVHEGSYAIEYSYGTGSENAILNITGLTPLTTYVWSAYCKQISGTLRTSMRILSAEIQEVSTVNLFAEDASYTLKSVVFTPLNSDLDVQLQVAGTGVGGETGLFDNVTIVEQ